MMLAAHALGLGTVWVHREREVLTAKKERLSCGSGSCRTLCGEEGKYADQ